MLARRLHIRILALDRLRAGTQNAYECWRHRGGHQKAAF
jgi:hypothetical protein